MTTINLHIERLVLDGLPLGAHEGPLVGEAVTAELTRLLARDAMTERFNQDRTAPLVRTDARLPAASKADFLGARIGRAIHGAVGR